MFKTLIKTSLAISAVAALSACSGSRPDNLGWINNQFASCPESPNCVSSFAAQDDAEHYIAPWATSEQAQQDWQRLIDVIKAQSELKVIKQEGPYLYAEATTKLMRYVDDMQFYLNAEQQRIDVYSASRLGYSDMGKNRSRLEELKQQWQAGK